MSMYTELLDAAVGQREQERARLEEALRDCGVAAPTTTDSFEAVRYRWPRYATPGSIAH